MTAAAPVPASEPVPPVRASAIGGTALAAVLLSVAGAVLFAPLGLAGIPLVYAVALVVPSLALARAHGEPRAFLGLVRPPRGALRAAALLGVSQWLLVLMLLAPILEHLPGAEDTHERLAPLVDGSIPLPLRLAMFAALPAVCEELLCRGVLCRHLAIRFGAPAGLALSSLYFAVLHFSFGQGLAALATGLACGAIALRAGSILPAMVLHGLNNATVILFAAPELVLADLIGDERWFPLVALAAIAAFALGIRIFRSVAPSPVRSTQSLR